MLDIADHDFKTVWCSGCGYNIRVPVYCRNRFCRTCSKSRAHKIRSRMQELLKAVRLKPGDGFKLLTLTMKSEEDLKSMCKTLLYSFRKLRNRKFWKRAFLGGCFVIEIKGVPGAWHAHLHVILQGKYTPQALILKHWRSCCGVGGAHIRASDSRGVIFYLTKYLTKECEEGSDSVAISDVLKDFRLFQPFGTWHGLLPKYKKKTMPCPDCGCTCWVPDHMIFGHFPSRDPPQPKCMPLNQGWKSEKVICTDDDHDRYKCDC